MFKGTSKQIMCVLAQVTFHDYLFVLQGHKTDRALLENPRKAGGGGLIRNSEEDGLGDIRG